ncbi:TfoX/Sxy family protein [Rhodoferax sp.]|uniref:TfoX/Sxy family protein n=1 Tax=Rhodoferax sp. TaxID=50421 RepID=UPI00374D523C
MASQQSIADFLLDQLSGAGPVSARKMFGEYCIYLAGKPVGFLCDDQFFLKPTALGRSLIPEPVEGFPYPGAKPHLLITPDQWDEREWLCQVVRATANNLPEPKSPKPRKPRI